MLDIYKPIHDSLVNYFCKYYLKSNIWLNIVALYLFKHLSLCIIFRRLGSLDKYGCREIYAFTCDSWFERLQKSLQFLFFKK